MIYVILFALATFLNLALALAFGAIGSVVLGFVAIFAAFVSMAAMFVTMFEYQ